MWKLQCGKIAANKSFLKYAIAYYAIAIRTKLVCIISTS